MLGGVTPARPSSALISNPITAEIPKDAEDRRRALHYAIVEF